MIPTYRSTSQRRLLKQCGWKYYLKYDQGWTPRIIKPGTLLGSITHRLLERALKRPHAEPVDFTGDALAAAWCEAWDAIKDQPNIAWSPKRKWEVMRVRGEAMMRKVAVELPKCIPIPLPAEAEAEWRLFFKMHGGADELVIMDLYAPVNGLWTVLDYKTSDRAYDILRPELDPQLTAGQLAAQQAGKKVEQVGLCVIQYGTIPEVQWLLVPARKAVDLMQFVSGAKALDDQIQDRRFHMDTDACFQWGRCEMYPICYPSQRAQLDELLEKRETMTAEEAALFEGED